jgi:hypothetical protein
MKPSTTAVRGVLTPSPPPPFLIEIKENVFKRLSALALKEKVAIDELGSALINRLLMLHRTEVNRVIDELKRRNHKCHAV